MSSLPTDKNRELCIDGEAKESEVVIRVMDSGPGIKPEDVSKIFQPHYTTKGVYGTGMGLYLSNQIIQAHGGSIHVISDNGTGTTFAVQFPRRQSGQNSV